MPAFLIAALYKFAELPDPAALKPTLLAVCEANQVQGMLLLAQEGINGTIAGPQAGVRSVLAYLRTLPGMAELEHKEAVAEHAPFYRMKVRLKKEIVTLGVPDLMPSRMAGTYVKPADWNALISDPDVVVVDTRNDYEVALGTFKGALDPKTKRFSELPAWVAQEGALRAKPKVAMFCTGGIRCEKSTAYLRSQGFDEVYHLEGGILKYLETVRPEESLWQGECFVFDERVAVGHGLVPGKAELCRSCRHPLGEKEKSSPLYVAGESCPYCHGTKTEAQLRSMAERHRQVELARQRGQTHIGAKMPVKPARTSEAGSGTDDPANLS